MRSGRVNLGGHNVDSVGFLEEHVPFEVLGHFNQVDLVAVRDEQLHLLSAAHEDCHADRVVVSGVHRVVGYWRKIVFHYLDRGHGTVGAADDEIVRLHLHIDVDSIQSGVSNSHYVCKVNYGCVKVELVSVPILDALAHPVEKNF
jgi:hypothetical protein